MWVASVGGGGKAPTPTLSILLRKWSVLLSADFVLTSDPRLLCYKTPPCPFYHKLPFARPFWVLRKDEIGS